MVSLASLPKASDLTSAYTVLALELEGYEGAAITGAQSSAA